MKQDTCMYKPCRVVAPLRNFASPAGERRQVQSVCPTAVWWGHSSLEAAEKHTTPPVMRCQKQLDKLQKRSDGTCSLRLLIISTSRPHPPLSRAPSSLLSSFLDSKFRGGSGNEQHGLQPDGRRAAQQDRGVLLLQLLLGGDR